MSKNTLQDKLKASIQRPAENRARPTRPAAAKKETAPAATPAAAAKSPAATTTAPAPAAKPSQPKKPYLNDERVWPD